MKNVIFSLLVLVAANCSAWAQGSLAADPKTAAAIEDAQKWYDALPAVEKQAVDKRFADYAAFMKQSNDAMNERLKNVENNERLLYIKRMNEEFRKRRAQ